MIAIDQAINGEFPKIREAIINRKEAVIRRIASSQISVGADGLDLHVGSYIQSLGVEEEIRSIQWLIDVLQDEPIQQLFIDSMNPELFSRIGSPTGTQLVFNSIFYDSEDMRAILSLASRRGHGVVCLLRDDRIPMMSNGRVRLAEKVIAVTDEIGLPRSDVYLDPLLFPLDRQPIDLVLETLDGIHELFEPLPITLVGLSNCSVGKKDRSTLNLEVLDRLLHHGLSAVIADLTDNRLMKAIRSRTQ